MGGEVGTVMNASRACCVLGIAALEVTSLATVAAAQVTSRVSVDSSGMEGDYESWGYDTAISADGNVIVFTSYSDNLVAGDTNGVADVFVHDRSTGITERVSVDSSGVEGNDASYTAPMSISADGQIVAFRSAASNLVALDTNRSSDVFVHDRATGITECVSVSSSGELGNKGSYGGTISADGHIVEFHSDAWNLVASDSNGFVDVFVHDRSTGITERTSVASWGDQGNGDSFFQSISADGQIVVFSSLASNLVVFDWNGSDDIFVHDRLSGITERVSVDSSGVEGNDDSSSAQVSADGQIVAFASAASNLVASDANGSKDVFVHDRFTGVTERVSVDSLGVEARTDSYTPSISADGQVVAFWSGASNLVGFDKNGAFDVFVHDRKSGITERVSVDSSGLEGDSDSDSDAISADGNVIVFTSYSDNLVAGDSNGTEDVFVRDHHLATWSNYGSGFPGSNGIPAYVPRWNPHLGMTLNLDLDNSSGTATVGVLFLGLQRTTIHSNSGGDLLVVPVITMPVSIPAGGASFSGAIPDDSSLGGIRIDLQAIEFDSGAAKGVSFTQGLELMLGY
jgi:cold shock CspA family protein